MDVTLAAVFEMFTERLMYYLPVYILKPLKNSEP